MNSEWKTFLEKHVALDDGAHTARDNRITLCELSTLGLIAVGGTAAASFLQGQFCNDVRDVTELHSQINAYCSPKGRVLALFRIFRRGELFYLSISRAILEATLKRLRMFVLRADVTLLNVSDDWIQIGLTGTDAEATLAEAVTTLPTAMNDCVQPEFNGDIITIIRVPGAPPRFEIFGAAATLISFCKTIAAGNSVSSTELWHLLDIRSGLPSIYPATVDAFVPQMLNLQAIGALSFTKGCYPGQEIVARMQYLGTLKRRMFRAQVASDSPPSPGDDIFTTGNSQSAGQIVAVQRVPEGDFEVLVVVQIASAETGQLHLHNQEGPLLNLMDLPYATDTASA